MKTLEIWMLGLGLWLFWCFALVLLTHGSMAAVLVTGNWFSHLFGSESGFSLMVAVYLGTVVGSALAWLFCFFIFRDEHGEVLAIIATYALGWLLPNLIVALVANSLISTDTIFASGTTWTPECIAAAQALAILSGVLLAKSVSQWQISAAAAIKDIVEHERIQTDTLLKLVCEYERSVGESEPDDLDEEYEFEGDDDGSDREFHALVEFETVLKAIKMWFLSQPTLLVGAAATILALTSFLASNSLVGFKVAENDFPFILLMMPFPAYFFATRRSLHVLQTERVDQFAYEVLLATFSIVLAFATMLFAFCGHIDVLRCPVEPTLTVLSAAVFWLAASWCYFRTAARWSSGLRVLFSRPIGIMLFGLAALYAAITVRGGLSSAFPQLASSAVLGLSARRMLWMRPRANFSNHGFLLVLRSYSLDFNEYGSNSITILRSIVPFVDGRTISVLIKKIRGGFPVLIEQNASEVLPAYDGRYSLGVTDRNHWQDAIEREMLRARSCLVIVGYTPGAIRELKLSLWIARHQCLWLVLPEYEAMFRALLWTYCIPLDPETPDKDNFAGRIYQFSGFGRDGLVTILLDDVMLDLSSAADRILAFCSEHHLGTNPEGS